MKIRKWLVAVLIGMSVLVVRLAIADENKAAGEAIKRGDLLRESANQARRRGDVPGENRDFEAAVAAYTEAIRLAPKDAEAYHGLARTYYNKSARYNIARGAYFNKDDSEKAISYDTQAIQLNPNFAEAYRLRAYAYLVRAEFFGQLAAYQKAISDFTESIRVNPRLAKTYYDRGVVYQKTGSLDKALEDFNEAIRLDPKCA